MCIFPTRRPLIGCGIRPLMDMVKTASSIAAPPEFRVPVEDLSAMHTTLAFALGEHQIGGARLEEIFRNGIRAECIGCGISITGAELGHITVTPENPPAPDSKLDRLRLGYCARQGCNS